MISESVACREAALSGRLAFINTGTAGAATVDIYGGTRPATAADAPGTSPLARISLQNPAGTVAAGVLALAPVEPGLILNTGTATWARSVNRDGATAFDVDVSDLGGTAEFKLSTTDLLAGGLVVLASATLR
jgi:hypothetical protein